MSLLIFMEFDSAFVIMFILTSWELKSKYIWKNITKVWKSFYNRLILKFNYAFICYITLYDVLVFLKVDELCKIPSYLNYEPFIMSLLIKVILEWWLSRKLYFYCKKKTL